VIALAGFFIVSRKPQQQTPSRTAEEMEQLKYDSEQHDREKQKADQLRDQSYLVRKENDNEAQLNSLMKDLDMGTNSISGHQTPIPERQAKAEEEAIAHVLRNSGSAPIRQDSSYQPPRRASQSGQTVSSTDGNANPMFVYSRSFGGAKYVDAPRKQAVVVDNAPAAPAKMTTEKENSASRKPDDKAQLIYTDYPAVTLYEVEMLDAVLVNRIIADTEPSPVVCQLSKDVFDQNARYVVLPAGSRIIGVSQVVTYKGAHRLFISFQRIILPNGPSIDLPASRKIRALDETGALGVVSKVERHWFLQFGTAIFFGVLDGLSGAAQKSQNANSTRSIILGRTSDNYDRVLENIMSQYSSIVPTIRVDQGKTMKIYLSDDLLITPYAKISDRSYYENR
jgi:type IV secretory pathway VirB10-like protein